MSRNTSAPDLTMRSRQPGTGMCDLRMRFLCGHSALKGKFLIGHGGQRVPLRCQACEDARNKR
jgi:hypothetical protein